MRFVVIFEDTQDMAEVRRTVEPAHLSFLETNRSEIPMAGGLRNEHGGPFVGGLWVFEVHSRDRAIELIESDPYYVAHPRKYPARRETDGHWQSRGLCPPWPQWRWPWSGFNFIQTASLKRSRNGNRFFGYKGMIWQSTRTLRNKASQRRRLLRWAIHFGESIMKRILVSLLIFGCLVHPAVAGICDYRPSNLIGGTVTGGVAGASGVAAATGIGMKAAGLYTLTHATTGAAMLGSTAAGASAAGTTGIIAGTSGVLGAVGAVLMSPIVIIPAAVTAVGIGAYEGGCYLSE